MLQTTSAKEYRSSLSPEGRGLGGIICNSRNVDREEELVSTFAETIRQSNDLSFIPRDNIVHQAEIRKQTVIEYAPESDQAALTSIWPQSIERMRYSSSQTYGVRELEQLMVDWGYRGMKMIKAIIRPEVVDKVADALESEGFPALTTN